MSDVNSVYFYESDIENKLHIKLLEFLMEQSYVSDLYNTILIKPADCGAFTVKWVQVPWGDEWGGNFKYVDEDQVVMTEICYPDGTFEYVEDRDTAMRNWIENNDNWYEDQWGEWRVKTPNNVDAFYDVGDE